MESHNQSFTALLYHYLSGNPTRVLSEGSTPLLLGLPWLSAAQIGLLSFFWTFTTLGITVGWIISGDNHPPSKWIPIVIGLLIVPSHLIWKPYFVMSLPLAVLLIHQGVENWKRDKNQSRLAAVTLLILFLGINLTGFDFVGHQWAAHFEAASLLLIVHLIMIGIAATSGAKLTEEVDASSGGQGLNL